VGKFMIIGLCGAPGAGKSTAAQYLAERYGLARVRFADPLKNMLRAYYQTLGVPAEDIERRIEGDLKTTADPLLASRDPRYAMQTLSTQWGRELIDENLWMNAWAFRVAKAMGDGAPGVVVEDVRFPNEEAALRGGLGLLVKIVRPNSPQFGGGISNHASEGQPLQ
jgi:hypothetical protein